jgi:putative thioredoxin
VDVTVESFELEVVERSRDVPVVADFWAEWCGPCKALGPVLEERIAERGGAVELVKIDVDANQPLAERFGISGIPAVKAFRDGRVVAEFTGARSPVMIDTFLDELLAPPRADVLMEELRSSGELPDVVAALDRDDVEGALAWILEAVPTSSAERRDRLREVAVALFERLGPESDLASAYRRRLASALY